MDGWIRSLDFISFLQKNCQDEDSEISEICIENRMLSY
jgi:hypothetical protein